MHVFDNDTHLHFISETVNSFVQTVRAEHIVTRYAVGAHRTV